MVPEKTTTKSKTPELAVLVAAAADINEHLGCDPAIPIKGEADTIAKRIIEETSGDDGVCDEDPLADETWAVLEQLGVIELEEPEPAEEEAEEEVEEEEVKPAKGKKASVKEKKTGGLKKVGIIATIVKVLSASKKGLTKDEVLEKLVAKFPDRPAGGMKITIGVQLSQLAKKGVNVVKKDDRYHIDG